MIKMVDTAVPMNEEGYPVARAKHIWLDDDTNLQKAIDDGLIGGNGTALNIQTLTQEEYDALDPQEQLEGEFYCYDSGRHFRNGVEYGKDGVQISDNETVEDKTWSSKKTSDEIAEVETELNAKLGDKADKTELNKRREIRVDEIYDSNSYYRVDAIGYYARPLYFRVVSTNGGEEILSFGQSVTSERKVIGKSVNATFKYIPPTSNASNGTLFIKTNKADTSLTIFYTQIYSVASIPTLRDSTAEEYATGTDFNVQELATMNKVASEIDNAILTKDIIYKGALTANTRKVIATSVGVNLSKIVSISKIFGNTLEGWDYGICQMTNAGELIYMPTATTESSHIQIRIAYRA